MYRSIAFSFRTSVRARSAAASGPSSRSTRKPSSSRIGTFNDTALSYFDPGVSPTTTKLVFFDTLPVTLPPRAVIASVASSREKSIERAGDHDRQPVQRPRAGVDPLLGQHHTGSAATCRRSRDASRRANHSTTDCGDRRADAFGRGQLLDGRRRRSRRSSRTRGPAPPPRSARRAGSTAPVMHPGQRPALRLVEVGQQRHRAGAERAVLVDEERAGAQLLRRRARTGRPRRRRCPSSTSAAAAL